MGTFGQDWTKALLTACVMTAVLPGITAVGHAQTTPAGVVDGRQKAAARTSTATMGTPQIRTKSISPVPLLVKPAPTKTGVETAAKTSDTTESRFFPASFHDWLTQSTMTGDWGGWRTWLTDKGINIGGHYLEDSAGNPMGGKTKAARYADEFGINIDFNLKKLTGLNLGMFHTLITARQGLGIGATLPAMDSPQQIFGSGETVRLTRLSWEMPWNKYVTTEVGEINTENDFEQSSVYWGMSQYCQFESNAICGMPQSIAMNSGYGWYPTAHPGAWVKFYPAGNDHYLVQFGAYSVDPVISNTHNGWKLNLHDATGTYLPFQLGCHQGGKDDYSGPLQTNIKIGGYWDTSEVSDVYSKLGSFGVPAQYLISAPSEKVRGRFGGWFQFDRMLQRDEADPNRGTTLFTSFTWGDPRTSVAPYFITWGVTRKGTFRSRPNDTISIGMKMLWVNPKLTIWARQMQAAGAEGINKPSGEHALELNYGWRPTPWLVIRPGAQYIWSTGGTNRYKNPLLLDFETGITF
ncbi:carbohydrate porin [Gluconobacter oxydans]|uniref:Carbohydrate porin n=1 Tax=Gluconobacter oxydans TaxID=442 RepID=A0AB35AQ13_GLUOY|nr:carbohydrate porin [Gluconobacter oxydans]MBF0856819.1 carbohydrate porin [Gluconobacter oxydans]TCW24452.1 porin [Gluconobacter oxydans]